MARRSKAAQALALRARIVLACADILGNNVVADKLGVTPHTVSKWRKQGPCIAQNALFGGRRAALPPDPRDAGGGGDQSGYANSAGVSAVAGEEDDSRGGTGAIAPHGWGKTRIKLARMCLKTL